MGIAVIIDHDSLRASGLRHLLLEHHGLRATTMSPGDTPPDGAVVYFATPEAILATPAFFMPRRARTVIVTSSPVAPGAFGALDPCLPEAELDAALSAILAALPPLSPGSGAPSLSARELDVLRLVAAGRINKEIATELGISFNTVLTHRKNITSKLGIRSTSGLAVYAMINGLITPLKYMTKI